MNSKIRASQDIIAAVRDGKVQLGRPDVRAIVDLFYQVQDFRKGTSNQEGAAERIGETSFLVTHFTKELEGIENQIKKALDAWTDTDETSRWAKGLVGFGPVLAAGLRAHIDIARCPTVGHIWSFAGIDGVRKPWGRVDAKNIVDLAFGTEKIATPEIWGAVAAASRRKASNLLAQFARIYPGKVATKTDVSALLARPPYNQKLKTLIYKIEDCFMKNKGRDGCVYGQLYTMYKAEEVEKNLSGRYRATADAQLASGKVGKATETHKANAAGLLNDGHIHSRAMRRMGKQFLADWHAHAFRQEFGREPPLPYPIAILGHAHVREVMA